MNNPNYPAYPADRRISENYMDSGGYGRSREVTLNQGGMTIRQSFVMEAMGKLAAKFTEYERTDSGMRVCPEDFETRSKEVAKMACLYADAALAEEARTRKQS